MTLYIFETNIFTPRFNFHFEVRPGYPPTAPGREHLEDIAERVDSTNTPEGVTVRLIRKPISLEKIAGARNLMASAGRKPVDIKRIPDIWTSGEVQTVSQAFKDLVDEMDPSVHQFIPVRLFENGSDKELTHTTFYHFACCRILDIPPAQDALLRSQTTLQHGLDREWPRSLRTIAETPEIQSFVSQFPIWRLSSEKRTLFGSEALVRAGQARKLTGFEETQNRTHRNVKHVFYEEAPVG